MPKPKNDQNTPETLNMAKITQSLKIDQNNLETKK